MQVAQQKLELDILNDEKQDNQEQISKLKEV